MREHKKEGSLWAKAPGKPLVGGAAGCLLDSRTRRAEPAEPEPAGRTRERGLPRTTPYAVLGWDTPPPCESTLHPLMSNLSVTLTWLTAGARSHGCVCEVPRGISWGGGRGKAEGPQAQRAAPREGAKWGAGSKTGSRAHLRTELGSHLP